MPQSAKTKSWAKTEIETGSETGGHKDPARLPPLDHLVEHEILTVPGPG